MPAWTGHPVAVAAALTLAVASVGLVVVRLCDPLVTEATDATAVRWATGVLALVAALGVMLLGLGRTRPITRGALAPGALVAATAGGLSSLAAVGLNGTWWGFDGVWSDASFRTEAATRFATSSAWPPWPDYAYAGLPAYYPPALPWIEARVAELLGRPGWAGLGATAIAMGAVVPVLGFLFWRRVLPDLTAATVVVGEVCVTANLLKPDEWLVLTVLLPWWLDLVGGHRRSDVRAWPWWGHGLVLGVLLLWHTYFFLPLGLASLAVVVAARCRGRRSPIGLGTALAVGATGLVVASPYWVPVAWTRLAGPPADDLQMRWSDAGWSWPPLPLPTDLVGAVALVGLVWLGLRARGSRSAAATADMASGLPPALASTLASTLAIATITTYAFYLVGEWLQRWGVAVLPEKSGDLIEALLTAAAVLAVGEIVSVLSSWSVTRLRTVTTALLVATLVVTGALALAEGWAVGSRAVAAQQTRYPDGSYPPGGPPAPDARRHPWAVEPTDPSVAQVDSGWQRLTGRSFDSRDLLVTDRGDLLATTPVHAWVAWKSIYSHPDGQFDRRIALLHRLSGCRDGRCAWRTLRGGQGGGRDALGSPDGLVLRVQGAQLVMHVARDTFPDAWRASDLHFDAALFVAPWFETRRVGDVAVVQMRARPLG